MIERFIIFEKKYSFILVALLGAVAVYHLICRDRLASDATVEDPDSDHDSDESLHVKMFQSDTAVSQVPSQIQ